MKKSIIKRKHKILIEAIDLLDEAGIQGLTTKEIANRQGITEPAIYRQFESKKHIVLAVLDEYSKYDKVIRSTVKQQKMSFEEKINYYVNSYTEYYQSYPQITMVMFSADVYRYDEETFNKMKEIIKSREDFLIELVTRAKEEGQVKKTCESEQIADYIHAIIWWYTFKWKVMDNDFDIKKTINEPIKRLINRISI